MQVFDNLALLKNALYGKSQDATKVDSNPTSYSGLFGNKINEAKDSGRIGGGGWGYARAALGEGLRAGSKSALGGPITGAIGFIGGAIKGLINQKIANNKAKTELANNNPNSVGSLTNTNIGLNNSLTDIPTSTSIAGLTPSTMPTLTSNTAPQTNTLSSVIKDYVFNTPTNNISSINYRVNNDGGLTVGSNMNSIFNSPVNYTSQSGVINVPLSFGQLVNLNGYM